MKDQQNSRQNEEPVKTGVIPDEQITGSDADQAYDEDGNFGNSSGGTTAEKPDTPEGTDADTD